MTQLTRREEVWWDAMQYAFRMASEIKTAAKIADNVLREFDDRFPDPRIKQDRPTNAEYVRPTVEPTPLYFCKTCGGAIFDSGGWKHFFTASDCQTPEPKE